MASRDRTYHFDRLLRRCFIDHAAGCAAAAKVMKGAASGAIAVKNDTERPYCYGCLQPAEYQHEGKVSGAGEPGPA